MNNLDIFREYLIRQSETWNRLKLTIYVILLNEEKKSLKKAQEELMDFRRTKGRFISNGEDQYQQNILDIANEHYAEQIEDKNKETEELKNSIKLLEKLLGYGHSFPISSEKLFLDRIPKVNWLFSKIEIGNERSKNFILDTLRVQIFGDLIISEKNKEAEIQKNIQFSENHLNDYLIATGEKEIPIISEEHQELFKVVKKDLEELVEQGIIKKSVLSSLKPQTLQQLKSWYGIKLDDNNGTKKVGEIIKNRIEGNQIKLSKLESQKKLYFDLINDFSNESKKKEWINEWIKIEIPTGTDEFF